MTHTVIIIAVGFALLALCGFVGHYFNGVPGVAAGALIFVPLWLIGAGINLYVGVKHAGYTVAEETPIFFVVFAIPAVAALLAWWRFH